jgi:hypothetical protein
MRALKDEAGGGWKERRSMGSRVAKKREGRPEFLKKFLVSSAK